MMVEPCLGEKIDHAATRASLRVRCPVDQPRNTGVQNRPGAHHARLERYIELATAKTVIAQVLCGSAQGGDLGVGARIARAYGMVVAAAYDHAVFHNDGANGHFGCCAGFLCERKRLAHERFVIH